MYDVEIEKNDSPIRVHSKNTKSVQGRLVGQQILFISNRAPEIGRFALRITQTSPYDKIMIGNKTYIKKQEDIFC